MEVFEEMTIIKLQIKIKLNGIQAL